ncbi:MAG: hypothetical protein HQL27_09195, partial [Candidatus Omnitrophica bacterium]|nr:hypothetical protein [Candidatus Omnitrophota bacterium]
MKNLVIILLCLAVLAAGSFIFIKMAPKPLAVEDIVPSDPLFYIKASGIKQALEYLGATKIWADLKNIDFEKLARSDKNFAAQYAVFNQVVKGMSDPGSAAILDNFLSREIAIAVYPAKLDYIDIFSMDGLAILNSLQDVLSNMVFVTRINPKAKAAEFFAGMIAKQNNVDFKKEEYKGQTINTIALE